MALGNQRKTQQMPPRQRGRFESDEEYWRKSFPNRTMCAKWMISVRSGST